MLRNKISFVATFLFCVPALAQNPNVPGPISIPWQVAHEVGWTKQQPSVHFQNLIYAQIGVTPSYGPVAALCSPPGSINYCSPWTVADASTWGVPCNSDPNGPAVALMIAGVIGITPGTPSATANLTLQFRTLGDTSVPALPSFAYIMQTETISDGSRTTAPAVVALTDCKFEWSYTINTTGNYPANPSYLINMTPLLWFR